MEKWRFIKVSGLNYSFKKHVVVSQHWAQVLQFQIKMVNPVTKILHSKQIITENKLQKYQHYIIQHSLSSVMTLSKRVVKSN